MGESTLRRREDIPVEYKWKLEDMFATDELWEQEYDKLISLAEDIKKFQGKLGDSADTLLDFYEKSDEISYYFGRVYVYANQKHHEDTDVSKYQAFASKSDSAAVAVTSALSFADPEILDIDEAKLKEFFEKQPKLENYRRSIEEITRRKAHTLSAEQEGILAEVGEIAIGPSNIFEMFNNADMKFPYITDVEGNKIQITHGNFIELLNSKDRSLRKQVFREVYKSYKKWGNTVSATYLSHVKQDKFYAKMRNYPSSRAKALDNGNIPESVYDNLIETVHKHLPAMHKYMAMRKKILGVEHLHMYDIYLPIVEDFEKKYSYDEAKALVKEAMKPMGDEYVSILSDGMENGWIDVYENQNKRSGAYSWGAYGTHPYVLLNHQDNLDCVFTLAHEMGHAMHTYFSNETQPITYAEYLIFVAEVASTCNESLLMNYMLEKSEDKKEKLYLINHYLDGFRTTLFRQTMFAEFEKIVHEKMMAGEALTKDELNKIYYDLNVLYYGPDMTVDEEIAYEWMRIPHFYTSFYVYQYATGYSAAIAFSKKILEEGKPAVEAYINNFLRGGCSKDPIDLLKAAGVDMSTAKPIDDALEIFEQYLEAFEKEL